MRFPASGSRGGLDRRSAFCTPYYGDMNYSARDIAQSLLADGVRPVTRVAEARELDLAFSQADPEGRMTALVIQAALRELGTGIADPDAEVLDYRQATFLTDVLRRSYPVQRAAVYEETPEPDQTIAHLMSGVQYDLSHAIRHAESLKKAKPSEVAFHQEHMEKHAKSAADHADRLQLALRHQYPAIGTELDRLLTESNLENKG